MVDNGAPVNSMNLPRDHTRFAQSSMVEPNRSLYESQYPTDNQRGNDRGNPYNESNNFGEPRQGRFGNRTPQDDFQSKRVDPQNNRNLDSGLTQSRIQRQGIELKKMGPQERLIVKKVLANVLNYLEDDQRTPQEVFGRYDYRKKGSISQKNMEDALYEDLYIEPDSNTELFIGYYTNPITQDITLRDLYGDLAKMRQTRIDAHKYDMSLIQSQIRENKFAALSKERLANYKYPFNVDEERKKIMDNRITYIKDFYLQKKELRNHALFAYLDTNRDNLIEKHEFVDNLTLNGFNDYSLEDLNDLFSYIDTDGSGKISLKEFKFHFYDREALEKESNAQGTVLDNDLAVLFKEINVNRSGYINQDDIMKLMHILGDPVTNDLIDSEFKTVDRHNNKRINFQEFKHFMGKRLRQDYFRIDNMIYEIKKKMKKSHPSDGQHYNTDQFRVALQSVCNEITEEESNALFFELDPELTNQVDIDDFINLIKNVPDDYENLNVTNTVLKLKKNESLSLIDLKDLCKQLPDNFCMSFTRLNFMRLKNLPSEFLTPKLEGSTIAYQDNYGEFDDFKTNTYYPIKPIKNNFLCQITFLKATGVPIPPKDKFNTVEELQGREIRA